MPALPRVVACWRDRTTTMAGYRTCSLTGTRQLNRGKAPSLSPLPPTCCQARGYCLESANHPLPKPQLPRPLWPQPRRWAGHPEAGGQQAIHAASRPGIGSTTQPLGPARSLKLSPSFLFGAGDAKAPPPPLFCSDHRSICCPHGGAPRQYHTGAEPQKTLLAAFSPWEQGCPCSRLRINKPSEAGLEGHEIARCH